MFKKRRTVEQVEESNELAPKFDENGLIVVTTVDFETNDILMTGFMNKEALERTIQTKEAYYYSRSRNALWHKGATSGYTQKVREILIDDDQDCLIYEVSLERPTKGGEKASCHVGYKSCFYRKINVKDDKVSLEYTEKSKIFDPDIVYKGIPNPTKI